MARVLVPLAQGCEELEAVTIIDLLRRAGVEVVTAALDDRPVHAGRGTVLIADCSLEEVVEDAFDMVVLPGGLPGADNLNDDPRIHQVLRRAAESGGYTAAICAAPKVLASAGILDGHHATAYPGSVDAGSLPTTTLLQDAVVSDGRVVTSRGPGTAMDFALELIEKLCGREKREAVEGPLLRA